jgi:hypothetical protein
MFYLCRFITLFIELVQQNIIMLTSIKPILIQNYIIKGKMDPSFFKFKMVVTVTLYRSLKYFIITRTVGGQYWLDYSKICHEDVLLSIIMLVTYEYIKLTEKVHRLVIKMFYQVNHCFIIMNA